MKNFRIVDVKVKERVMDYLHDVPVDGKTEVVFRIYKASRSLDQNARLHSLIGMCADEAGYTIEEMKLVFKEQLLQPIQVIEVGQYRVPVYKSTAKMKTKEFNEFMERVEFLASQWYHVALPARSY